MDFYSQIDYNILRKQMEYVKKSCKVRRPVRSMTFAHLVTLWIYS
jgi:hypothetical protein